MQQARNGERRTEFGHEWEFRTDHHLFAPHWRSTSGNCIRIFPPSSLLGNGGPTDTLVGAWVLMVHDEPDMFPKRPEDVHQFTGDDVERRVFSVGEVYTRQHRGPLPATA